MYSDKAVCSLFYDICITTGLIYHLFLYSGVLSLSIMDFSYVHMFTKM